jgi:hypothetical protein
MLMKIEKIIEKYNQTLQKWERRWNEVVRYVKILSACQQGILIWVYTHVFIQQDI